MRKSFSLNGADCVSSYQALAPIQNPLERSCVMSLGEEMACSLDVDLSSLPSDIRGTARHLASRHHELGKWQSLTGLSMSRVEREVDALESLKVDIEKQLEERQTYVRFVGDCVKFKENFDQFVPADVHAELLKELQLTNEVISTMKNHCFLLQSQINALKDLYAQLNIDYQDKSEAIKLMWKCIVHSRVYPGKPDGSKQMHITYDKWKSECDKLQNTSDTLLKESASLRGNIQFTRMNLKNASESQRSNTNKEMRKKIHTMKQANEEMRWKLKVMRDERDDLMKTTQKVAAQIRNCEARTTQNSNNLYTLNQRQRNELCLDQAHNSLTLQKYDLSLISSGLERMKRGVHANLEEVKRRMADLEGAIHAQEKALQTELKCQDMYQNILPLPKASLGSMNNSLGAVNFLERLQ